MRVIDVRDLNLIGKRVLLRADLNVPIAEGSVTSDARIRAALGSIEYVLNAGAKVMVMSHLGRPKEGIPIRDQSDLSMQPVADRLSYLMGSRVRLLDDYLDGFEFGDEDFVLLENVRVNKGEKANDETLARRFADLCDVFVMDAFGTAHRAQATTEGVARFAPVACAGQLLLSELAALEKALAHPKRPVVAIVGGSKVSTKFQVLDALSNKVDHLIVGGGIANTCLAATGLEVGQSLYEPDFLGEARALMRKINIPMPVDVVTAKALDRPETAETKPVNMIEEDDMVLDIGPETSKLFGDIIEAAATIIWNGPVGVFEEAAFSTGTRTLTTNIAASRAFSIAGGGDTLAAIDKYGAAQNISYISTGGGAFLKFIEGRKLPAVAILEQRALTSD